MTTIQLTKSGNVPYETITIYAGKIEETISKDLPTWQKNYKSPKNLPVTPTDILPILNAYDFLNVTREFSVTGFIDGTSTAGGNALTARDTLINMIRSGKKITFNYGLLLSLVDTLLSSVEKSMSPRCKSFNVFNMYHFY